MQFELGDRVRRRRSGKSGVVCEIRPNGAVRVRWPRRTTWIYASQPLKGSRSELVLVQSVKSPIAG